MDNRMRNLKCKVEKCETEKEALGGKCFKGKWKRGLEY